ncbi:hypothetical protein [Halorubrum sp. CBA1229]|jgi:hypothetical protein|uniref:hypothetical protein n=1 Tax=Halorubrum sp. CBA1229 TaxID=1853699 RepID=UPI000F40479E|nr:hypothetical protein [Halorubrum sp. CBA1229]QKY17672.1 hypothetical protein Hrr1229_012520 [Halorubrum sp. CBA1229]
MTTKSQDRALGLTVLAFLVAISGELLGVSLLVTIGVTGFFLAVAGLLALMTISLIVGVSHISGPDMRDSVLSDRDPLSAPHRKQ